MDTVVVLSMSEKIREYPCSKLISQRATGLGTMIFACGQFCLSREERGKKTAGNNGAGAGGDDEEEER